MKLTTANHGDERFVKHVTCYDYQIKKFDWQKTWKQHGHQGELMKVLPVKGEKSPSFAPAHSISQAHPLIWWVTGSVVHTSKIVFPKNFQVTFKHSFSEKLKYLEQFDLAVVSLRLVMARQCFPTLALSANAWLVWSILAASSMATAVIVWMTIDSTSLASESAHRHKRDHKNVRIRICDWASVSDLMPPTKIQLYTYIPLVRETILQIVEVLLAFVAPWKELRGTRAPNARDDWGIALFSRVSIFAVASAIALRTSQASPAAHAAFCWCTSKSNAFVAACNTRPSAVAPGKTQGQQLVVV